MTEFRNATHPLVPRGKVNVKTELPRASSYKMRAPSGILIHDTVTPLEGKSKWWTRARVVNMCANGVNQGTKAKPRVIPGPLYHFLIRGGGDIIQLTGYDYKSNNAGSGDGLRLQDLLLGKSPLDRKLGADTKNGNAHLYGVVLARNGKYAMPNKMRESLLDVLVTIFEKEQWPSDEVWRVLGHREWTKRKRDPVGVSMDTLRYHLNIRLQTVRKGKKLANLVKEIKQQPNIEETTIYAATPQQQKREFNLLWWWIRDWNNTPALRNKPKRNKQIQLIVGTKLDGIWGKETQKAVNEWLARNEPRK